MVSKKMNFGSRLPTAGRDFGIEFEPLSNLIKPRKRQDDRR